MVYFNRDSEGAFGSESATRGGSFWARIREKLWRDQVVGVKMSETNGNKLLFFSRDSEAAFGSESATRGGSFWTRITLGKAVAAPGVRGQDAREKWKKSICVL